MHIENAVRKERAASQAYPAMGAVVVTCEHGGNRVPDQFLDLFPSCRDVLDTHAGFDRGALLMARELSEAFRASMVAAMISRLVVDLNRSVGHPRLHCQAIRRLPVSTRQYIVEKHYQPYRAQVRRFVMRGLAERGRVVHIASHSFTPELHGEQRRADIGLLYDPARPHEAALCARWKAALQACVPDLVIRRNYPYAGTGDGLTTTLRENLSPEAYLGVELEVNQKHVAAAGRQWASLRRSIIGALRAALSVRDAQDVSRMRPDLAVSCHEAESARERVSE